MANLLKIWIFLFYLIQLSLSEVYQLDETNFDEMTQNGLWYLEFYAPWCGHCKKFAPIYEEASNEPELKDVRFGAIDATSQKQLAKQFGVSRFPTLKLYVFYISSIICLFNL